VPQTLADDLRVRAARDGGGHAGVHPFNPYCSGFTHERQLCLALDEPQAEEDVVRRNDVERPPGSLLELVEPAQRYRLGADQSED